MDKKIIPEEIAKKAADLLVNRRLAQSLLLDKELKGLDEKGKKKDEE